MNIYNDSIQSLLVSGNYTIAFIPQMIQQRLYQRKELSLWSKNGIIVLYLIRTTPQIGCHGNAGTNLRKFNQFTNKKSILLVSGFSV